MRICAFILLVIPFSVVADAQKPAQKFAPGELLVKFKKGSSPESITSSNSKLAGRTVETLGDLGWQRIKTADGADVEKVVRQYQALETVEHAQPNFYYQLQLTPNDPGFPNPGMYGLTKISAPQAWDIATGSSTVVIANIDTGIRYTHEDLAANMWVNPGETPGNSIDDDGNGFIDDLYGYDFRFNDADPMDEHWHGTHTAGTLGAAGNNSIGVVGLNWNVKLMAIKIYSASLSDTTSAMLINAYNYVRLMKNRGVNIRVTNNSYGGCNEACGFDQATKDAIDALGDTDILNVFAAGNTGMDIDTTPFYPASYTSPSILSVAASDHSDSRPSFSGFGLGSVDLAAPGLGIYSTSTAGISNSACRAVRRWRRRTLQVRPHCSPATIRRFLPYVGKIFFLAITIFSMASSVVAQIALRTAVDFDNDDKADYLIFRPDGANWWIQKSGGGMIVQQWGLPNDDYMTPGDYDGDGIADIAVWRETNGVWYVINSQTSTVSANQWGTLNDEPVARDYNGDGKTDLAVVRNSGGHLIWYVMMFTATGPQTLIEQWGIQGDFLAPGDYDGNGSFDFAIQRPGSPAIFYIRNSGGDTAYGWGETNDLAVPGDYDLDGKTDVAVVREGATATTDLLWIIRRSSDGSGFALAWGQTGTDLTVQNDYNGDGRTEIAVWRQTDGTFWTLDVVTFAQNIVQWGAPNDYPIANYDTH